MRIGIALLLVALLAGAGTASADAPRPARPTVVPPLVEDVPIVPLGGPGIAANAAPTPGIFELRPIPMAAPKPAAGFSMQAAVSPKARAGASAARATVDFDTALPAIHLGVVPGGASYAEGPDGTVITIRTTARARQAIGSWPQSFIAVLEAKNITSPDQAFRLVKSVQTTPSGSVQLRAVPMDRSLVRGVRVRFQLGDVSSRGPANLTNGTGNALSPNAAWNWGTRRTVYFNNRLSAGGLSISCTNCYASFSGSFMADVYWSWFSLHACAAIQASASANVDVRADFRSASADSGRRRLARANLGNFRIMGIFGITPFVFVDGQVVGGLSSGSSIWATYGFDASATVRGAVRLAGNNGNCGSSYASANFRNHGFGFSSNRATWSGYGEFRGYPGLGAALDVIGFGVLEGTAGPELDAGIYGWSDGSCKGSKTRLQPYSATKIEVMGGDIWSSGYKYASSRCY